MLETQTNRPSFLSQSKMLQSLGWGLNFCPIIPRSNINWIVSKADGQSVPAEASSACSEFWVAWASQLLRHFHLIFDTFPGAVWPSSSVLCAVIGEFLWNVAINVTVGLGSSDSAEAGPGQAIKRRLAPVTLLTPRRGHGLLLSLTLPTSLEQCHMKF